MKALEIRSISKTFRSNQGYAVDNVDLEVSSGEILALVGESGSGKTTMLRLIAGFEKPDQGQIFINQELVSDPNYVLPPEKRKLGMVFQDYALFPHLTVRENVSYGLTGGSGKSKRARVSEVLQLMTMAGLESRYPHHLSGGEQQRVALARALAPQPRLILMDEPFSNLDERLKDQMRVELRNIMNRIGITVLLVTHDTRDALSTADRIAILRSGSLQQVGAPQELYSRPASPYVASFFGRINLIVAESDSETCKFLFQMFNSEVRPKGRVRFVIRPEDWVLSQQTDLSLSGVVSSVNFFGDHWEASVKITGPVNLPPIVMRTPDRLNPGEAVRVTSRGRKVQILGDK